MRRGRSIAATVLECHDELIEASGLPAPHGDPLARYSPGVEVRIGQPERYGPSGRLGYATSNPTRMKWHAPATTVNACQTSW